MAQNITFEQFLHHTNAEEIIVEKMKEAGPRIYQLNYDRRLKHCKVLYKKFYDFKLRDSVLNYGLVLKPMPNVFKAKFLQFPLKHNNKDDNMTTDKTEHNSEKKQPNKSPNIEDKYKNDLPSTSSAFEHKPRLVSPSEKNKNQLKTKSKPETQHKLQKSTKKDKTASKTTKNPSKSSSKRRISFEKPKSSNKSPKITNYFLSNAEEESNPKQNVKLRKRISDAPDENIEIEPRTKVPKMSPVKKRDTNTELRVITKNKLETNSKGKNKGKTKRGHKSDENDTSLDKKKTNNSDDIVSDDCDINSNNSVVNLTSDDSKKLAGPNRNVENNSSPSKSILPKRNKIEEYEKILDIISKKLLKEISPEKATQPKKGFTINEIELWIKKGQKALEESEDNNENMCTAKPPFRKDVYLEHKLQTIKANPEKVKKFIKYWLNFEIQMRKGLVQDLEATAVGETSKVQILSAFSQMTFEDFKNLINVQKYISRWTSLGKSKNELEEYFNNHYTVFMQKEKPWPKVHIELAKLQSYIFSKGIKGQIPLKNIPPRILSFDEVLEKTNIKECMSLSCERPPESFKELLSLCKKEYEKCCSKGVWIEGLKFVENKEEGGSSQEMSIELLTEPTMSMSPLKVTSSSGNVQENVMQKEPSVVQILNDSDASNEVTKGISSNEQRELEECCKDLTNVQNAKLKRLGQEFRQKHSTKSDDEDIEMRMSHICGGDEQQVLKYTNEPTKPIDTQELNQILAGSQTHLLSNNRNDIPHSEEIIMINDSETCSLDKVTESSRRETKQSSDVTPQLPEMDKRLTPSPNIFTCSDEINMKCSTNVIAEAPQNMITTKINRLKSSVTDNIKSTYKDIESVEKDNVIPPSPNIFHSSGESDSKCIDSDLIQVQTQESVYVPCELNNNFNTEQNNFSISMNEVSESEDPFGEAIVNGEETCVIMLDTSSSAEKSTLALENTTNLMETIVPSQVSLSCEEVSEQHLDIYNSQVTHNSEANVTEQSIPIDGNLDSVELAHKTTENSEETVALKKLLLQTDTNNSENKMVDEHCSLPCKVVSLDYSDASDSHENHIIDLNVSDQSISVAGNLESNEVTGKTTENSSLSVQTATSPSLPDININQKQIEEPHSIKPFSVPTTDGIVDEINSSLMAKSHSNTNEANLAENAFNSENENSGTKAQSAHDAALNVSDTVESQSKELREESVQPVEAIQNVSGHSGCCSQPIVNQEDLNKNGKQTATEIVDNNTYSNKNTEGNERDLETGLNSSVSLEHVKNLKIAVKREIFSQQYSQYCDDVEIIELPQSEAMVIDDEETAPELLEALLCNPSRSEAFPITTVHTTISHPTSLYLDNFPQAQQFPSNFDVTQSQSNLNQSNNQSTYASSQKTRKKYPGITIKRSDKEADSFICSEFKTPHKQAANTNSFSNIAMNVSSGLPEEAQSITCKKQSDHKQKQKLSSSPRQLSEEMSEMSFVSIAPQNFPSDIEFSQTSLNKFSNQKQKEPSDISEESEKRVEKVKKHCFGPIAEQLNSVNETSRTEKHIKSNEIHKLSPPNQSIELESKSSNKNTVEQVLGIDEGTEEQLVAALAKDSLDKSSDVELLEESTDDEMESDVITTKDNKVEGSKKQNEEKDLFSSNSSKDTAQQQVEVSTKSDLIEEKGSNESGVLSVGISKEMQSVSTTTANTTVMVDHDYVNVNSDVEYINLKNGPTSQEIQSDKNKLHTVGPGKGLDTIEECSSRNSSQSIQKGNTSDDETSLEQMGELSAAVITTSTQVDHAVSSQNEIDKEGNNAVEASDSSSVELVDFSFYYISSDDDKHSQNDKSEQEEKFSHTLKFKELPSVSKNYIADSSKTVNGVNNEELLETMNEGSDCVFPILDSLKKTSSSEQLTEKTNFVTTRRLLKHCNPINRIVNDKEATLEENSCIGTSIQSSNNLQTDEYRINVNVPLNTGTDLVEGSKQAATTCSIDEYLSVDVSGVNSLETGTCSLNNRAKKLQEAVEQVLKIKKNLNISKRRRTLSEQLQPINITTMTTSFSQPTEVHDYEKSPNHLEAQLHAAEITKKIVKPLTTKQNKTISLEGFIPVDSLKNIQTTNGDYVEVPMIRVEKRFLSILSSVCKNSELTPNSALEDRFPIKINIDLTIPTTTCIENPISTNQNELQNIDIPLMASKEMPVQEDSIHNTLPNELQPQVGYKAKIKMPSTSTKKPTPKKHSKPPDFVQQKTHAFSSIPLKPCKKTVKRKPPSLLSVEECDYLIEDASQPTATSTISQILGTDCTYFENSELLRNLDDICIPHQPNVPELQITQLAALVPKSPPPPPTTTNKVINLIPITLSEGVTARKVWQVNLQWKSQNKMSIEVRFSFNRLSMTACDESAKLLFNFPLEIWSDIHKVLREIDQFEYKRRALKNPPKLTSLHKVLGQLFSSSSQIVDVKLINDSYNPFTICEKTIPVYRKPFQCLTNGINPDILSKMKFLKENLQKTALQ